MKTTWFSLFACCEHPTSFSPPERRYHSGLKLTPGSLERVSSCQFSLVSTFHFLDVSNFQGQTKICVPVLFYNSSDTPCRTERIQPLVDSLRKNLWKVNLLLLFVQLLSKKPRLAESRIYQRRLSTSSSCPLGIRNLYPTISTAFSPSLLHEVHHPHSLCLVMLRLLNPCIELWIVICIGFSSRSPCRGGCKDCPTIPVFLQPVRQLLLWECTHDLPR